MENPFKPRRETVFPFINIFLTTYFVVYMENATSCSVGANASFNCLSDAIGFVSIVGVLVAISYVVSSILTYLFRGKLEEFEGDGYLKLIFNPDRGVTVGAITLSGIIVLSLGPIIPPLGDVLGGRSAMAVLFLILLVPFIIPMFLLNLFWISVLGFAGLGEMMAQEPGSLEILVMSVSTLVISAWILRLSSTLNRSVEEFKTGYSKPESKKLSSN